MRIPICLDRSFVSEASNKMNTLKDNDIVHKDFLDISWLPEDLELIKHHSDIFTSSVFTIARVITLAMAIIVHRAFYKLMKRLPGRAVNEMIYPNMVRYDYLFNFNLFTGCKSQFRKIFVFKIWKNTMLVL